MIRYETSYGIIPLQQKEGEWRVLLVLHGKGHWAFPKGHGERTEKKETTAERELKEETNLSVIRFLNLPCFKENYVFHTQLESIHKTVVYWAAEVGGTIKLQEQEVIDAKWLSFKEANKQASFPETKRICLQLCTFILRSAM